MRDSAAGVQRMVVRNGRHGHPLLPSITSCMPCSRYAGCSIDIDLFTNAV